MSCLRMSPLAGVALLALRGRWLVGLVNGAGARDAAAAPHSTVTAAVSHWTGKAAAAPWTAGLLRGGSSAVSQFFVWVYVVLGVLIGLTVLSAIVDWVVGEIKLRRECTRPLPPSQSR
ncbi:MAG TPA: hypothetical protein VH008_14795 [Pseudonocardia sp.]|jgi:hypothetical protein|nr:hypothetical protein [Pseudonocardia sp.]